MRRFIVVVSFIALAATAQAAEPRPVTASPAKQPATRIETDQKTGVIRFIVNGKEVARIDANGLHVRGNVDYTGTLTDI